MLSLALANSLQGGAFAAGGRQFVGDATLPVAIVAAAGSRGNSYGQGYDSHNDEYDSDTVGNGYDKPLRPKPRYMPQSKGQATQGATFMTLLQNQKQLGALLLAVGLFLTIMGMALFFEGNLLRLGNICLIVGIPLLIGPDRVRGFFMKESRIQASIITSIGILLVFWGKPRLGILCEIFGLLNLFGNMFPLLLALAKRMPIIGDVLTSLEGGGKGSTRGRAGARQQFPEF